MKKVMLLKRGTLNDRYQARLKVPYHLQALLGKKGVNKDFSGPRDWCLARAEKWAEDIQRQWQEDYGDTAIIPCATAPRATKPQSTRYAQARINDLVREAYSAQEAFDNFDCDTVNRPSDMVKLRALTTEWDKANLALIRYVLRNGETLIHEYGGRVSTRDRETIE